jgi:plastocyanin
MSHSRGSLGGTRTLGLALLIAGALMAIGGLSAQAAGNEGGTFPGAETATETGATGLSGEIDAPPPATDPGAPPTAGADMPPVGSAPAPADAAAQAPAAPAPAAASAPTPPAATSSLDTRATASVSRPVSIIDFAFDPASLQVKTGDTVQWTNKDAAPEGHDVTGDGLDSGLMKQGDTYSHTFKQPGTFSYICTIHPQMKGSVEVLASKSSTGADCPAACGAGTGSGTGSTTDVAGTGSGVAGTPGSSPSLSDPAGTLAFTGWDPIWLVTAGLLLLDLGVALRVFGPARTAS